MASLEVACLEDAYFNVNVTHYNALVQEIALTTRAAYTTPYSTPTHSAGAKRGEQGPHSLVIEVSIAFRQATSSLQGIEDEINAARASPNRRSPSL